MKELSIEEKAKRYDEALEKSKRLYEQGTITESLSYVFPELKESEDERIRKELTDFIKSKFENPCSPTPSKNTLANWIAWIEKQGKPNPYSGVSFDYNGHIWGMCARDNGVEILFDGELKAFLSLEKSFIYPIHPQPELPKTE